MSSLRLLADDLTGALDTSAELVGLLPEDVLFAIEEDRWTQLDLGVDKTLEYRLRKPR